MLGALKFSRFPINGNMKLNDLFGTKRRSAELAYSKNMSVSAIMSEVDKPSGRCMVRRRSG